MIWLYLPFAVLLIWLSLRSFVGGINYLRYVAAEISNPRAGRDVFVTLIAPFRGKDDLIEENIAALFDQDYERFEILFVVDDPDDPAVPYIKERLDTRSKLIVAPKAADSSQKVENLRFAVAPASKDTDVYAFVDSDVRPGRRWLSSLVSGLKDASVGASTGYRWFISPVPTFATELRSVWNASIATSLGPGSQSNFCWGGSMAIKRETFEKLDVANRWKGTLSDDLALTRMIRDAGLQIVFVPGALVPSFGNTSLREVLEFTTRQMKITRVYSPHLWIMSLIGSSIFIAVMISSAMLIFASTGPARYAAAFTLASVSILSIGKAWLRSKAVRIALPEFANELDRQQATQLTLWLITPVIFLYNSLAALLSRRVTWRGTTYELKSPVETVIISD